MQRWADDVWLTLTCFISMGTNKPVQNLLFTSTCWFPPPLRLSSGLPLSSSSTCPCLNESRGALFLARRYYPRGACLLLLYFWDTHCMMGSQWPPHSLCTHILIALHSFVASTRAEVESRCSWVGHERGCMDDALSPCLLLLEHTCQNNWCVYILCCLG